MSDSRRTYSSQVFDGPDRAPSRAMMYAVGHEKEDFDLLFVNEGSSISIYSAKTNYHTPLIGKYISSYPKHENYSVDFIPLMEDAEYEG